ncbi:DNA repair exonuclease [Bacillus sp. V3B]|nr:DNA repair exonuclease [Bacillus sp. V3B]
MKQITFIHAADLHLDSPMIGLSHLPKEIFERLKESTFVALKKLTDAAIQHQVDFVILAGDLFDEDDRSVRAQTRLRKEMKRLEEREIPVYVIHGNHDHLNGTWVHLDMPENVHVFSEKVEIKTYTKPNVVTYLYGFSYETRHVTDNRLHEYVKKEGADLHIGILHGHDEGTSEHGLYAPFRTEDLIEKKFDYWALGHIHKRRLLHEHPPIVYPGNIQGRHKKEKDEKGCYLVTLTPTDTKLDFIETADIQWETVQLDGKEVKSFQELLILCYKTMEKKRIKGKGVLLSFTIQNMNLSGKELENAQNGELLQALQDEEREEDSFVWPIQINIKQMYAWDQGKLEEQSEFYHELFQVADNLEYITDSLHPLYDHHMAAKFLPSLSEKEKLDLGKDALQTLIRLLHQH